MFAVLCILYKNDTQEAQNSTCWRHRKLTLVLPQKEGCVRVIKGRQINFMSHIWKHGYWCCCSPDVLHGSLSARARDEALHNTRQHETTWDDLYSCSTKPQWTHCLYTFSVYVTDTELKCRYECVFIMSSCRSVVAIRGAESCRRRLMHQQASLQRSCNKTSTRATMKE